MEIILQKTVKLRQIDERMLNIDKPEKGANNVVVVPILCGTILLFHLPTMMKADDDSRLVVSR
jgi:hypothetical protein